jgi:hypothetical protein
MNKESSISIKRLVIIFFFALFSNFIGSWYAYAMTHNQVLVQAILGLCIPFSSLFYSNAFIEAKTIKDRIKITFAAGMALSIGSTLMLFLQENIKNLS